VVLSVCMADVLASLAAPVDQMRLDPELAPIADAHEVSHGRCLCYGSRSKIFP
jgi:hypothetical protein